MNINHYISPPRNRSALTLLGDFHNDTLLLEQSRLKDEPQNPKTLDDQLSNPSPISSKEVSEERRPNDSNRCQNKFKPRYHIERSPILSAFSSPKFIPHRGDSDSHSPKNPVSNSHKTIFGRSITTNKDRPRSDSPSAIVNEAESNPNLSEYLNKNTSRYLFEKNPLTKNGFAHPFFKHPVN